MVSNLISRRNLLRGLRDEAATLRPPFSQVETVFVERCDSCGNCIRSCPEKILIRGAGGLPQVDFSNGNCTFCAKCADVCDADAFGTARDIDHAWDLRAVVSETCLEHKGISCRACESWCEPRAIRFRPAIGGRSDILLDQSICTGCGACVAPCPQASITITHTPTGAEQMSPAYTEEIA